MNIKRFVTEPNGQGMSCTLSAQKLRPSGCLENSDLKNAHPVIVSKTQIQKIKQIRVCLRLLQDILHTVRQYDVDIGSICEGRERESEKNSPR